MSKAESTEYDTGYDKVECQLCNARCHSIALHLRDDHGPKSLTPCSVGEYMDKFPGVDLLSGMALQRLEERKKNSGKAKDKPEKVIDTKAPQQPMAQLFGLGRAKAAKNNEGGDIMVEVCQDEGYEELIPVMNKDYVYPIDTLKTLLMAMTINMPSYIYGHSGVGKSTMFEQICGATKRRMIRVQHTINTEESHIVGQWTVKKFKDPETNEYLAETVFEPGPLTLAMKYGWVYLADEFDRGHPSVLSVYQAVLEGKSLVIKEADAENRFIHAHPNFRFVATGNTNGSGDETGLYQATIIQDAATFERFGIVEKIDYMSRKQEIMMIRGQTTLIEEDAEKVVNYAEKIRESFPAEVSLTIGPRVTINIAKIGVMRGDFKRAIELCYANRLPESEREAAMAIAQRIFG